MKKKKADLSISIEENNKIQIEGNNQASKQIEKHLLIAKTFDRLSNTQFWKKFKKHFEINSLDELCSDCFDFIKIYVSALKGEVDNIIGTNLDALNLNELLKLKRKMEPRLRKSGRLRFLLKTQEERMKGMLQGIDQKIVELGEKPEDIFMPIEPETTLKNVTCPFCGYENKNNTYNFPCENCLETIGNPWKEHTICPQCQMLINRSDIFSDKVAYRLDTETNFITCTCGNRFDWKQHRREPRTFSIKYCIACDKPYRPDKRNWKKQRICSDCKEKGVDVFYLDHPDYQSEYRKGKK